MGAYYLYVNVDKRECINPKDFGVGIKFSEIAYSREIGKALAILLQSGGRWCGDRIVLAADEAGLGIKDEKLLQEINNRQLSSLHQLAEYFFDPVTPGDLE